jgi:nucleotide-binding universal stress UspA family protein
MNAKPDIHVAHAAPLGPSFVHPTDFSAENAPALAHAVALAQAAHARLTLLHIRGAEDAGPTRNGLSPVTDLLIRWGRLSPADRFAELQPRLGFSATCLDVPARSVAEGVLEHFAGHPVELAVLTTHAHSGLSYWFAGSIRRRVLRQADAMLLFLRAGARGFVDPASGAIRLARVLMPLDGRIPAAKAVTRARALLHALAPQIELRLLHVGDAPPPDAPKDIPMTVAQGAPAEVILRTAQNFRADLIVMPTAGKRGLLSAFRASVTAEVLDDARWPVLSVPAT